MTNLSNFAICQLEIGTLFIHVYLDIFAKCLREISRDFNFLNVFEYRFHEKNVSCNNTENWAST